MSDQNNNQTLDSGSLPVRVVAGSVPASGSAGYSGTPMGYQQLSVPTATALTVPVGATWAIVEAEADDVRFRDDGTNPTAAIGTILYMGQSVTFVGAAELAALKFITVTSGGILNVNYRS